MVSPVSSGQAVAPKAAPASTAPNPTFDQLVGGNRSLPEEPPSLQGRVTRGSPIAEARFFPEEAEEEWVDCGVEESGKKGERKDSQANLVPAEGAELSADQNAGQKEAFGCDFTEVFPVDEA